MAQQVALLPAITLISQLFFATFFGFLGLFLSLPLTVVGQIWFKEVIVKDVMDNWNYSYAGNNHLSIQPDFSEPSKLEEE